jgi:hypothetical protein
MQLADSTLYDFYMQDEPDIAFMFNKRNHYEINLKWGFEFLAFDGALVKIFIFVHAKWIRYCAAFWNNIKVSEDFPFPVLELREIEVSMLLYTSKHIYEFW